MKKLGRLSLKTYMAGLLIILAIIGIFQQGISQTSPQILIATSMAILLDFLLNYIRSKKIIFSSSAFITGMIIALVLNPGVEWFIPLAAAFIAIAQKYIIRYKGKHIFNPANFGLLTVFFIFSAYTTWWGQSFWPLIVLVGVFASYRMKRLDLPLVFIGSFTGLFVLNNVFTKQPLSETFLLINIFFVFIMLIEPKTSPVTRKGRIVFGMLAASISFVIFKIIPQYDFSILSLAIANIFVPFLNRLR